MNDFKRTLRKRQLLLATGLVFVCCALLLSRGYTKAGAESEFTDGFITGFQVGGVLVLVALLVSFMVKNMMALRDPERLKKLYISCTDERNLFILQKTGSVGTNIILYGLAVATAVAGNVNNTVFFALLASTLFVASVKGVLKILYHFKY